MNKVCSGLSLVASLRSSMAAAAAVVRLGAVCCSCSLGGDESWMARAWLSRRGRRPRLPFGSSASALLRRRVLRHRREAGGRPFQGCTGVLGSALVASAVAARARERFGGPVLGWRLVAAYLVILLRLRRTEVPEMEPRRCMGMIPGRRATAATPRHSRWGSYSTHKADSGDGVPSVQGLAASGVFLCCSSRRRRRSATGVGLVCVEAPQGLDCIFSCFGGLFAFVLGHMLSLVVSRRYCVCAMFVTISG